MIQLIKRSKTQKSIRYLLFTYKIFNHLSKIIFADGSWYALFKFFKLDELIGSYKGEILEDKYF